MRGAGAAPRPRRRRPAHAHPKSSAAGRIRALFPAILLTAAIGAAGAIPSAARAGVPEAQQQVVWQHICENLAEGTVSPQEALVCVHSGFPVWPDRTLVKVERICERPLGGTYEYRSEFPTEFAACFFE
jgi:hypothetical protein